MTIIPFNGKMPDSDSVPCEYCGKEMEIWRCCYEQVYKYHKEKERLERVLVCIKCLKALYDRGDIIQFKNKDGSINRYEFVEYRLFR